MFHFIPSKTDKIDPPKTDNIDVWGISSVSQSGFQLSEK